MSMSSTRTGRLVAPAAYARPPEGERWPRSRLTNLAHSYLPQPNGPRRLRAEGNGPCLAGRRGLCAAGRLGLRQDHASEHHLGAAAAHRRGASCSTSRDVTDAADRRAQHRAGVPVSGGLRHDDRARQSGLPAAQPRHGPRPISTARVGQIAADDRHGGHAEPQGARADRRCQAEDQPRARHGPRGRERASCSTSR